jgi:hypothetical protein
VREKKIEVVKIKKTRHTKTKCCARLNLVKPGFLGKSQNKISLFFAKINKSCIVNFSSSIRKKLRFFSHACFNKQKSRKIKILNSARQRAQKPLMKSLSLLRTLFFSFRKRKETKEKKDQVRWKT